MAGGSFDGIEQIARRRTVGQTMGFGRCGGSVEGDIEPAVEDFCRFGLIPEFIGRFPVIRRTRPLTAEDLARILLEPTNSLLARYRQLLELDSIGLEITPDGAREIASEALRLGTGARGLDQVLERLLFPFRFDPDPYAGRTVVVDRDLIAKAPGKTG